MDIILGSSGLLLSPGSFSHSTHLTEPFPLELFSLQLLLMLGVTDLVITFWSEIRLV